jgi:hypothetical protein
LTEIDELRLSLEREIQHLKTNLMNVRSGERQITDRLLSRLADRNDIIRINTLEWVLKVIEKINKE